MRDFLSCPSFSLTFSRHLFHSPSPIKTQNNEGFTRERERERERVEYRVRHTITHTTVSLSHTVSHRCTITHSRLLTHTVADARMNIYTKTRINNPLRMTQVVCSGCVEGPTHLHRWTPLGKLTPRVTSTI